jgi:hypothetical protein
MSCAEWDRSDESIKVQKNLNGKITVRKKDLQILPDKILLTDKE